MTRLPLSLAALALLAGCTVGTDFQRPEAPLPSAWRSANAAPRPANAEWWKAFNDPVLDRLAAQALASNPDIDAALARIDQSRAGARAAGAALLPAGEAQGTLARARQSLTQGLGQLSQYVPDYPRTQDEAKLGVAASWDLDFAGGLRRGREAARADLIAAQAGADAARLSVVAELVDTYLGYRGAQTQLETMGARRAALADRRGIMAARVRLGEAPASALDQLDAALAGVDALLPLERSALVVARNRIAILTGSPAGTALPELEPAAPIPVAADPAAGVPGDILRYRPDVAVAEAQLHAAHARIGVALADYWPKISLSGLIGFDTNTLSRFGSDASNVIQGAAGLRWRLFDFGRVDAEVASARGKEREALAAYRGIVLKAGEQVESGFTQLGAERAELDRRLAQRDALARAEASARAAFKAGEISRDALREAELSRMDGDDAVTAARTALARATLGCFRALGG